MSENQDTCTDKGTNVQGDFGVAQNFDRNKGFFDATNSVLWWIGWRQKLSILAGIIAVALILFLHPFIAFRAPAFYGSLLIGSLVGTAGWYGGVSHINSIGPAVVSQFHDVAPEIGRHQLNIDSGDVKGFNFIVSMGRESQVDISKQYRSTVLLVGESSVAIHGGVVLDMVGRSSIINDDTRELFYDQITGVSYERNQLLIRTSDGGKLTYPTSREPTDALETLQNRVREYKS